MGERSRLLLVGCRGMLAADVARLAQHDYDLVGVDLPEVDICSAAAVDEALRQHQPDIVLNCAAFTAVDRCESEAESAFAVNGAAVGYLARAAREQGATLVHISTDYVFSGQGDTPWREDDPVAPLSVYGRSKLAGEQQVLASGLENYLIVRTSWLFGPAGNNFVETVLRLAAENEQLRIVADQVGRPTYTEDLAGAILKLLASNSRGIFHFANAGPCSWFQFAEEILARAGAGGLPLKAKNLEAIASEDYPLPAPRPKYSVLATAKYQQVTGAAIPDWREALERYFQRRDHKIPRRNS